MVTMKLAIRLNLQRFFVALWASALAPSADAEEFSWQLSGGAREADVGNSAEAESATLGATYYFRPVDDSAGPYALAPFLNRSSYVGGSYHEDKTTGNVPVVTIPTFPLLGPVTTSSSVTVVTRAAGRTLSGRHVWRTSGWYAGASLAESDAAHPAPLPATFNAVGDDLRSGALEVGKYVGPSTAVELSLEAAESSFTSELNLPCSTLFCAIISPVSVTTTLDADYENVGVSALHVGRLGRLQYSLAGGVTSNEALLEIETVISPPTTLAPARPLLPNVDLLIGAVAAVPPSPTRQRSERYALAGELFPTQALGIRVGYARWDGDTSLDESYEVGATWFFKRRIGAQVVLARTKSRLPVPTIRDSDTVTLQLIGRL